MSTVAPSALAPVAADTSGSTAKGETTDPAAFAAEFESAVSSLVDAGATATAAATATTTATPTTPTATASTSGEAAAAVATPTLSLVVASDPIPASTVAEPAAAPLVAAAEATDAPVAPTAEAAPPADAAVVEDVTAALVPGDASAAPAVSTGSGSTTPLPVPRGAATAATPETQGGADDSTTALASEASGASAESGVVDTTTATGTHGSDAEPAPVDATVTDLSPDVVLAAVPLPVTTSSAPANTNAGTEPSVAAAAPLTAPGTSTAGVPTGAPSTVDSATPPSGATTAQTFAVPVAAPAAAALQAPDEVAAPAAPARAQAPDLVGQLSRPIQGLRSFGDGTHTITIQVTPDNLGPVAVRAHVNGDNMRIELVAPTEQAREAIKSIMADLRRDLSGAGGQATLDLSSGNQPSGRDNAPREGSAARGSEPAAVAAVTGIRAGSLSSRTDTGLDVLA